MKIERFLPSHDHLPNIYKITNIDKFIFVNWNVTLRFSYHPPLSRYFPPSLQQWHQIAGPGHFDKWRSEGNKTNFKLCNWWLVWGHSDKIKRYFLLWPGHKHQWAQCPVVMPVPPLFVRPMKKLVQIIHKQKESLTCGNGTATIFMTMSFVSQMNLHENKKMLKTSLHDDI